MRVLFLGAGAFGVPTLEALVRAHEVVGVITQPDRPAGRGRKLTATPIAQWSLEHLKGAALIRPDDVNTDEAIRFAHQLRADAWVIIAFGQKLGESLLSDHFAVNLHASRLPRWRGAAPINHAILARDAMTGNSVITIAQRMDAGLVLGMSTRAIAPDVTAGMLHDQLAGDGPALVLDVLEQQARGMLNPAVQDESSVTRATKLGRRDGWVDFSQTSEECRCRINGLSPWPGVKAGYRGRQLGLVRATRSAARGGVGAAGEIVDARMGLVACADGVVQLLEVQPEGKSVMAWGDFANGHRVVDGERLVRIDTC